MSLKCSVKLLHFIVTHFLHFISRIMTTAASPVVSSTAPMSSTRPSCRHGPTWPLVCTVSGWANAAKFALKSCFSPGTSSSMTTTTPGRATTTITLTRFANTPLSLSTPVGATAEGFTRLESWEGQTLSLKVTHLTATVFFRRSSFIYKTHIKHSNSALHMQEKLLDKPNLINNRRRKSSRTLLPTLLPPLHTITLLLPLSARRVASTATLFSSSSPYY